MPYTQYTRAQLRTYLLERLGAPGPAFYRTTELNFILQESLRFFNLLTGFWKTRALFNTTSATWYQLPNAITGNMRVTWQGYTLSPASAHDISYGRPTWVGENTTTGGDVPKVPTVWVIGAINLIGIWPQDANPPNSLIVDGLAATPILTADSQSVDLGQEELNTILDYCEHIAMFKQGGAELKDSIELLKAFLKSAAVRSDILKQSATYRKWLGLDKQRWQTKMRSEDQEETQVQGGAR